MKVEVKTGINDGKYTEIKPLEIISEGANIVTAGAFFLLSESKMGGEMDACGD